MTSTPLVMIPGLMCDARCFAAQTAAFSSERGVTIANVTRGDTMRALAEETLAQSPPRFALLGFSMGGMAAMQIMRDAPERVERLALVNTIHLPEHEDHSRMRDEQIPRARAGELAKIVGEELTPAYGPADLAAGVSLCVRMAEDLGVEAFVNQSRALQTRPDSTETMRGIKVPTLALTGANDILCTPEFNREMSGLAPGSVLRIVEDTAHLALMDRPDAVNAHLREWLAA